MQLKISDYEIDEKYICLEAYNESGTFREEVRILKTKFASWLKANEKLDWVKDSSDHNGDHVQQAGTWNFEEYLNARPHWIVEDDLVEYLQEVVFKPAQVFDDILKSIKNITNVRQN